MTRRLGTEARIRESTEARVLRALQHSATLDATSLAERLGVHKTTVYAALRNLVLGGQVRRIKRPGMFPEWRLVRWQQKESSG